MKKLPKISFLIRTIECRKELLIRAVRSVANQSYPNYEAIVVQDGGSTLQDTICALGDQLDISVNFVGTNEQVGRSAAANIALNSATGDYVNFLDDDDILLNNHAKSLAAVLNNHKTLSAVYAASLEIEARINCYDPLDYEEGAQREIYHNAISSYDLLHKNIFPIQAVMFRRSLLDKGVKFDLDLDALEDWLFWQQLFLGEHIEGIPEITSHFWVPLDKKEKKRRDAIHTACYPVFLKKQSEKRINIDSIKPLYFSYTNLIGPKSVSFDVPAVRSNSWRKKGARLRKNIKKFTARLNFSTEKYINNTRILGTDTDVNMALEGLCEINKINPENKNKTVIYTSVNNAYLPKAMILGETLKKYNPEIEFHILLSDYIYEDIERVVTEAPYIDVLYPISALKIERKPQFVFSRNVVELCTAVKPFYANKLLDDGYDNVIYFDPDMAVFSNISPILEMLKKKSVLITPHCTEPGETEDEIEYNEISCLAHGTFNLGFVAFKNDVNGRRVAKFWEDRLYKYCYSDVPRGLFTDQKWFDLVPIFFEGVEVVRHKGMNVASWNLARRPLERVDGRYLCGGDELVFFHFSGFDQDIPKRMMRKFGVFNNELKKLLSEYEKKHAFRKKKFEKRVWIFDKYENGQNITAAQRKCFKDNKDLQEAFLNPFETNGGNTYFDWIDFKGPGQIERLYDDSIWVRRHF